MKNGNLSAARYRAWDTRRKKYGVKGHSGRAYSQTLAKRGLEKRVIEEIDAARRFCQLHLPSKSAHKAIDHIDYAIWLLRLGYEPSERPSRIELQCDIGKQR